MWLYHSTVTLRPLWSLYWRFGLEGAVERIPPSGPLLVTMNHLSFLDPWFLAILFPRPVHFLINDRWYNRSRAWRFFFDANGTLPVRPEPRATIEDVCGYLARGRSVMIFPEGRISPDGKLRRFRQGIARAAARSGAPVVPLGIRGSFRSLPRTRRWPRPGPITLHVGEPLVFPGAPVSEPSVGETGEFCRKLFEETRRLAGETDEAGDPAAAVDTRGFGSRREVSD